MLRREQNTSEYLAIVIFSAAVIRLNFTLIYFTDILRKS